MVEHWKMFNQWNNVLYATDNKNEVSNMNDNMIEHEKIYSLNISFILLDVFNMIIIP
jgi:hypothetical protein